MAVSVVRDRRALLGEVALDQVHGEISQRGFGVRKLCEPCNNDTGRWYGDAFLRWTCQCLFLANATGGSPRLEYPYKIFPLRVIKQVTCMLLCTTDQMPPWAWSELRGFVLGRYQRGLDPRIRVFAYCCPGPYGRATNIAAIVNINTGQADFVTEFAFPPMGYLLTLNSEPPDARLLDITDFARFQYDDFASVTLRLQSLPVSSPIPGDYRAKDEVDKALWDGLQTGAGDGSAG